MDIKEIGEFIKGRRSVLRLQQTDLAELSNVSLRTIIQIEKGIGNPSIDTLNKIGKVLGYEIQFTVKGK